MHTNITSQKANGAHREYQLMEHVTAITSRQFLSHARVSAVLAESPGCHPQHHSRRLFGGEDMFTSIKSRIILVSLNPNK